MDSLDVMVWLKLNNPCVLSLLGRWLLDQACDVAQKADVAAVVMQEGLANLVLVTPAMTLLRAKVEVTIPRKRRGSCTQHEKVSLRPSQSASRPPTCRSPNGVCFKPGRLWRGSMRPWCRPSCVTSTLTVGPDALAPLPSFKSPTSPFHHAGSSSAVLLVFFGGFSL